MGYAHSVFLILAGLAYILLLFDTGLSAGIAMQASRISLILMAPLLWGFLLLNGKPKTQLRSLNITQIVIVLLLVFYYYLLWSAGTYGQWLDGTGGSSGWVLGGFAPIFGYIFLSLSVRVLARNLRKLSRMDRLRG